MQASNSIEELKKDFKNCQEVLLAIGDETRQAIIITLMDATCSTGMRVGEITRNTHLSRPAVSHHIKILKDAGIINVHRVGTLNYYYLDPTTELLSLKKLISRIEQVLDEYRPANS